MPNPPMTRSGAPVGGDALLTEGFRPPDVRAAPPPSRQEFADATETLREPEQQADWIASRMGHKNYANSEDVVTRAKSVIVQELAATKTTLEYLRNKWLILYRLYRGETLTRFFYGRNNIHVPEPYKAVETIVPRMMAALFDIDPWLKVVGQHREFDGPAKNMQALLDHQFYETDLVSRAERMIRTLCIYGTMPCYAYWRQDIREVSYREIQKVANAEEPGTFKTVLHPVEREEVVFDGNDLKPIELWDYYAPPLAASVDEAEWIAHRALMGTDQLQKMGEQGLWLNLDQLKDSHGEDTANFADEYKQRKSYSFGVFDPNAELQSAGVGHWETLERWGLFDIEGDGRPVECQIVMIQPNGRQVITRVCKNPYWHGRKPYIVPRYTVLEGEHFGMGVIEPIAKLSLELDQKRQLELAATQLSSNPMLVAVDGANIPDEQLHAEPGLVLRTPMPGGITPLIIPDVSDAAIKSQQNLKVDIRETTGAGTTQMGAGEKGEQTATEINKRVDEGNVRIRGAVMNWGREFTIPLADMWSASNQQFMTRAKAVRAIGPQGMKWQEEMLVTPEKITGRFDFFALPGHRLNNQMVQVQQLVNLLDRVPILNQMVPNMVNVPALLARIMREGFGIKDIDEIIQLSPVDQSMFSALEEHALWKYGTIPAVHSGENLFDHGRIHEEHIASEEFLEWEKRHPGLGAKARAHVADTHMALARLAEAQGQQLMLADQQRALTEGPPQEGGRGAAGPGQDPGSPKVRREQAGPAPKSDTKPEAMSNAPNEGAS